MSDDLSSVTGDFSSSSDDYVPEASGRGYKLSQPTASRDDGQEKPAPPQPQPAPAPAPQPAAQPAGSSPPAGAYDQRGQGKAAADRMAREVAKHPPKVDPAAMEARIKDLEQKFATMGSSTIQQNGNMLSARKDPALPLLTQMCLVNGIPTWIRSPGTILGPVPPS